MNRRKTDLIIDTQAFANSCALLDNAKLREALAASEKRLSKAESLLAEAGDQLMFLELAIGSTADTADLVERIDGFLPKTGLVSSTVDRLKNEYKTALEKLANS